MEFVEAHNNLRAIRLLYRLLHDNNYRLQNEYSDDLIERARGLLKHLLDVVVVSVFQTHLKIIATQEGISKTSFEQEKHMTMLQSKSQVAANKSQSSVNDPTLSAMTSQKNEQPLLKLISEKEFPISISDNGGTDLVKTTYLTIEERISPETESGHYEQPHNQMVTSDDVREESKESLQLFEEKVVDSNEGKNIPLLSRIDEFQYNTSTSRNVESPDQKGDFSNDLLNAMKRIESRVFALQHCSNLADSTKNNAYHQTMNGVANLEQKQIANKLLPGGDEMGGQNRTQGFSNVKPLTTDHIQDLRVQLNQDDLTRSTSKLLCGHANRKSLARKSQVKWSENNDNQKKKSPEHSYAQKPVRPTGSNTARRQKPPPHQVVIRPTLLDQRSSEIKVFSCHKREESVLNRRHTQKSGHAEPWKTRVQPQNHEKEEQSSSNTQSSSSWTSQPDSGNCCSSSTNSEDHSLPSRTEEGSTSGTMVDASFEGSSGESNNNSYTSNEDDNPSDRFGSMKSYRHYPKRNDEKKVGGLKRLKNKLGLIFHRHHQHHHHHYDNDDDDSSIHFKRGRKHSVWNNLQHVFHQKNKQGVLTKRKVDKTKRVTGVEREVVPRGNQVGHFHRLVEGLVSYMRHSKKRKSHKLGGVNGSKNKPHGRHGKKKLHWWQMLQQRRGVKMKNKGRVKVGFVSQNSPKKLT